VKSEQIFIKVKKAIDNEEEERKKKRRKSCLAWMLKLFRASP
jgi:hypothetical protein